MKVLKRSHLRRECGRIVAVEVGVKLNKSRVGQGRAGQRILSQACEEYMYQNGALNHNGTRPEHEDNG